jgi:peptidoglycan hydrolase FlgJ
MEAMTSAAPVSSAYAFTDIAGVNSLRTLGKTDRGAALAHAARQFESMFVSQMLKGMRAANEVLAKDSLFGSNEMSLRQDMLDQQLSLSLTQGRGLGLAAVLERQLRQQFGEAEPVQENRELPARPAERQSPEAWRFARTSAERSSRMPAVVSSALKIIKPIAEQARETLAGVPKFADKQSFIDSVLPAARRAAHALGVDHRVLIAQSALETGWGQSILRDSAGNSSFNLFNIKAGNFWEGRSVSVNTLEFNNGIPRPERASFRAYASFNESFADYVDLLRSKPRYEPALANAHDPARYLQTLQQSGYATDPKYAAKILRLLEDPAIAGAL